MSKWLEVIEFVNAKKGERFTSNLVRDNIPNCTESHMVYLSELVRLGFVDSPGKGYYKAVRKVRKLPLKKLKRMVRQ